MTKTISLLLRPLKNIFPYKFFKIHSKRTMQNSPYKGRIVPVNTSFANQDLSHQDFTGTDFSNCDIKDAILTGCIFDKANLSQVQNLKEKQFAGCSLIDAILPKDFKFSYLDNFDKMMAQARDIFALSLSTSLFGIIAVMSTADEDFLVGGKSLTMPLIGVAVDMTSLYIFLPITIMAVGLYLNIYLNKIQSIIKKFPYYLPDGREIELLLYPWLWNYITKPLYYKKRKLRLSYAMFAWLGGFISYAMVHVTAALSIMIITFTYFKVQDPIMTTFHLGILGIVTFFAFLHFRIKYRERKFVLSFLMPISAFAFTVLMAVCGSFVYTEKPIFVNLKSEKRYTQNISYENIYYNVKKIYYALFNKHVTDDHTIMSDDIVHLTSENISDNVAVDIAYNIKEIYAIFFHPDITVINKNISYNPSGCTSPKDIFDDLPHDKACNSVVGVDLRNRNLINLNAANSFFAKALLYNANLQNANLIGTDLRWAHLWKVNLRNANLEGANLEEAFLKDSNLQFAHLNRANLQNANLGFSDLKYAYLNGANLKNADLGFADLEFSHLGFTNLRSVNLQDANLRSAKLQKVDLWSANLIRAKLQKVDLRSANLKNADLIDADLQDSNLSWANLQNTILINTNLSDIQFNEKTKFINAFYNSRPFILNFTYSWSKYKKTLFPSNFIPTTKGMIDVCTSKGKEALKQAIQKKHYKYIRWEDVKDTFEKWLECVPSKSKRSNPVLNLKNTMF